MHVKQLVLRKATILKESGEDILKDLEGVKQREIVEIKFIIPKFGKSKCK